MGLAVRAFALLAFLCIGAFADSQCLVTLQTWRSSSSCTGAAEVKTITADNNCHWDGGEHLIAVIRGTTLITTYFENDNCSAEFISAEPTKYINGQCTELGGGVSAIATWVRGSACGGDDSSSDSSLKQTEPCYWSDYYKLPGQSFQEFVCHDVADGSTIVFDSSSDSGTDAYSIALFGDRDFQLWAAGEKAFCVNVDCITSDTLPKFGSYSVDAANGPYHIVLVNPNDAKSSAVFDLTVSVSVGNAAAAGGEAVTGSPPPPPPHPPTPPPPHPPTPPPPHPPTPPPPHPPTPPPPHPPTPPPPHPPTPPPPHPPTPPPPHPPPPPPHPPTPPPPPPPGPIACKQIRTAISNDCTESPKCNAAACHLAVYDETYGVGFNFGCNAPISVEVLVNQTSSHLNFSRVVDIPGEQVTVTDAIVTIPNLGPANLTVLVNISGTPTDYSLYAAVAACITMKNITRCHPAVPYKLVSGTFDFTNVTCPSLAPQDVELSPLERIEDVFQGAQFQANRRQ
eukprot:TRINITY_DN1477_c0_g1_i1.p1 TRINITY_DN1477_c0_g1~~TRINITY_DN1477_c0_g1_i1.p1  ORF type:complete len:511 (+),score=93.18 TRINITY_DN1477_c0_g1_i1:97-1629(+)